MTPSSRDSLILRQVGALRQMSTSQIRAVVALTVAIPLSTWTIPDAPALDSDPLVSGVIMQLVIGAALGMLVQLAVAAIQTVGDFIDVK